jgi:hypothetical protein
VWRKLLVTGHTYERKQNKMVLYLPDRGIREIKHWWDCELWLKSDWVLATKESIKAEAGQ